MRNRKNPQSVVTDSSSSALAEVVELNIFLVLNLVLQAKKNVVLSIRMFLNKYGFRCINELKLEEKTLHDDPGMECCLATAISDGGFAGFILDMITGYIQSGAYSIASMEEREVEIRKKAEDLVQSSLPIHKRIFYNWILYHARKGTLHCTV